MPNINNNFYQTMNVIATNAGYNGSEIVDYSTFATFAQNVASMENLYDAVYDSLIDRIKKVSVAIRPYRRVDDDILVDSNLFGAIIEKISYEIQDAEANSTFGDPVNPYTVTEKKGIHTEYYHEILDTVSWTDVINRKKLRSAFTSPVELQAFIDGLYERMQIAKESSIDYLIVYAKNALFASTYLNTANVNYNRRVRKVLSEYNANFGTSLNAQTALYNRDFLAWLNMELTIAKTFLMEKYTKLFNDGSVQRRTYEEFLRFDVNARLTGAYAQFYGDSYNPSYVTIPKHRTVADWGIATEPLVLKGKIGEFSMPEAGVPLLCAMYDRDAVYCSLVEEDFSDFYDAHNKRNVIKQELSREYIVSQSENCIIWTLE